MCTQEGQTILLAEEKRFVKHRAPVQLYKVKVMPGRGQSDTETLWKEMRISLFVCWLISISHQPGPRKAAVFVPKHYCMSKTSGRARHHQMTQIVTSSLESS
jgi:hypothetical protein